MFLGTYYQKVDDKKRIVLPTKYRSKLSEEAVITLGHENSLVVYTSEEWVNNQNKLLEMSDSKIDHRKYIRTIAANAVECNFDSHGRVVVPDSLLKRVGIEKEIVLIGVINHIEIWAKEAWDEYNNKSIEDFDKISEGF